MAGRCNACGSDASGSVVVREMMFGTRQPFDYRVCGECETASLSSPPADMGDYYPDGYYSKASETTADSLSDRLQRRVITGLALHQRVVPARVRYRLQPLPEWTGWFDGTGVTTRSRILDVGSGGGRRLAGMARDGFKHLEGSTPSLTP